jgi:transposase
MKTKVKQINHLGIISGMCNEIELAEVIDRNLPSNKRKVSVGLTVKAMILNALGFTGRAMYLTPESYRNRPTETLIGEGITPDDLHDDCLGTALDVLYENGLTELFYKISSHALKNQGIEHKFVHLDSTSFSLHGQYDDENEDERVVKITKGLSKDNAPELNQVVLSMMCSHKSTLPVWIEVLSGNSSDKSSFRESIKQFKQQFNEKQLPYFVADSALYSKQLNELEGVKWVTRVPETINEAKKCIKEIVRSTMIPLDNGYSYLPFSSNYGDVEQRWLVVFSEQAYKKECLTFNKNFAKSKELKEKELWHLGNSSYACEEDAEKAVQKFNKSLKFHKLDYTLIKKLKYEGKGRPAKNSEATKEAWYITGELREDSEAVENELSRKGIFIIATNELYQMKLSDKSIIEVYKDQGISVERGFRFLKDPMFYAESLYLNSPKRIMALVMVMTLSLLIYSLAEKKLRDSLLKQNRFVPNQVGKPIQNPTIRWIFQLFTDACVAIYEKDGNPPSVEPSCMDERHLTTGCWRSI